MVDDAGVAQLEAEADEPSRFDVVRDPMWVLARLESLTEQALAQLHDQALQLNARRPA